MTSMAAGSDLIEAYARSCQALEDGESARHVLSAFRSASMRRLMDRGFPNLREETWKGTDLRPLLDRPHRPAAPALQALEPPEIRPEGGPLAAGPQVVLVNGRFVSSLSTADPSLLGRSDSGDLSRSSRLGTLAQVRGTPFVELNGAFLPDVVSLGLGAADQTPLPLHVTHVSAPEGDDEGEGVMNSPRLLIEVAPGARACLVETYLRLPGGPVLTNAVTEIFLGAGARLDLLRLQWEGEGALHVGTTAACLSEASHFEMVSCGKGGRIARHDVHADLVGTEAFCALRGLVSLGGTLHSDTHVFMDHRVAAGRSLQLYKSILDGASRSAFTGRILVHKDAQKTDARQANHNLLLSRFAKADTRPQLEILADDVRCTHGATVGQMDEEALLYLRSRALDLPAARALLVRGFAAEIVLSVAHESVREELRQVAALLPSIGAGGVS